MADSWLVPLPTVKNSLSAGRGILEERFSQLVASGDIRSHHPLGLVTPADEEAVMNGIASVIEGIEHFTKLAQVCGISLPFPLLPLPHPMTHLAGAFACPPLASSPPPPSCPLFPPSFPPLPISTHPPLSKASRETHNTATPE